MNEKTWITLRTRFVRVACVKFYFFFLFFPFFFFLPFSSHQANDSDIDTGRQGF